MGTLKNGIMGGFSGRLGNVVIYEMYGKTVVRSLPSVKQKMATGKRKQYQDDFRYVMKWMQLLKPMIDRCWPINNQHNKPFKQAFSYNLKSFRELGRPESYDWLKVSQGSDAGPEDISFVQNGNKLSISWSYAIESNVFHPKDSVFIKVVNLQNDHTHNGIFMTYLGDNKFEFSMPEWNAKDPLIAFLVIQSNSFAVPRCSSTMYCVLKNNDK